MAGLKGDGITSVFARFRSNRALKKWKIINWFRLILEKTGKKMCKHRTQEYTVTGTDVNI